MCIKVKSAFADDYWSTLLKILQIPLFVVRYRSLFSMQAITVCLCRVYFLWFIEQILMCSWQELLCF